ncbi:hypothetical protein RDV89_02450 [Nocardioides zeae]|uniref:Lipoprotein n=1 Tax=Nocardioides imazamoxiresistens TaxID=3231893 RepID=A0ABU3PSU1_9ACTN|nr:hypothetical protein [Nocardioides zeae]MDT9591912.1 hypothetical protein [Nocardioides zeae]
MRLRQKSAAIAVAVALTAALSACGSDDDADDSSDDTSSSATEEASDDASDEPTEDETESDDAEEGGAAAAPAGDLTEPGTTLAIGDTATVPYGYAGNDGVIAVTVTGIEQGDRNALVEQGIDDLDDADQAYYIRFEFEAVENAEGLAGMNLSLDGMDAQGNPAQGAISFQGGFGECESGSAPSDWDGSAFENCSTVILDSEVTAAFFSDGDYSAFSGNQVTWE